MSLLNLIDEEFNRLRRLTIDGVAVHPQLPQQPISVVELKSVLLHPSTSFTARDAALMELAGRAKGSSQWQTALIGVLLPGIRRAAGTLASRCPLACEDLESEIISGVIEAIGQIDTKATHVASKITWAGYRRGLHSCCVAVSGASPSRSVTDSAPPPRFGGHPDFILEDAVQANIITTDEAELIGGTRLGDIKLAALSEQSGVSVDTLRHRRNRAERRLVAWLRR